MRVGGERQGPWRPAPSCLALPALSPSRALSLNAAPHIECSRGCRSALATSVRQRTQRPCRKGAKTTDGRAVFLELHPGRAGRREGLCGATPENAGLAARAAPDRCLGHWHVAAKWPRVGARRDRTQRSIFLQLDVLDVVGEGLRCGSRRRALASHQIKEAGIRMLAIKLQIESRRRTKGPDSDTHL